MMCAMTVTSPRSVRVDQARTTSVAVLGIAQVLVAAVGGSGGLGTPVGAVALAYRSPLLAASWAFDLWFPIYLGFLAYAGYQCFPRQRHRQLHRRTGWWLAASAVFNMAWVLSWTGGLIPLAELAMIGLMVTLAVVFGRLSREIASSGPERIAFRGPVALYAGWASMALVMGTAATGVWLGLPGDNAIASAAAVIVLVAIAAIVAWVILNGTAVLGYAAAVAWALVAIELNGPPPSVAVTGAVVLAVVLAATARRLLSAADPARAAFG